MRLPAPRASERQEITVADNENTPKSLPAPRDQHLRDMADCIRVLAMDAVQQAKSGHPGMPMGMADIATVLFSDFMRFDAADPHWIDRDRFVISNGHGSMLLYALLYLTGYADMTIDELKHFRQVGAKTAGHPEYRHADGIETTTGPLGQGLANSVGMALAERIMNATFGDTLVDHYTYVFMGDGCLMEGISHEAISLAGHLKLGKLIAFFDNNSISIDGATSLSVSDDQTMRFRAVALACPGDRRPRYGRHQGSDHRGAAGHRQAVDDLLPHGDRLRPAHQGRHPEGAQRRPGRGRDRRRPQAARLDRAAVRDPGTIALGMARDRRQGSGRTHGMGRPGQGYPRPPAAGFRAPHQWRVAGRLARRDRRGAEGIPRRRQGHRHPPGQRRGAEPPVRRHPRIARRLGRPHAVQQHEDEEPGRDQARRVSAGPTCITACASTAWRRR